MITMNRVPPMSFLSLVPGSEGVAGSAASATVGEVRPDQGATTFGKKDLTLHHRERGRDAIPAADSTARRSSRFREYVFGRDLLPSVKPVGGSFSTIEDLLAPIIKRFQPLGIKITYETAEVRAKLGDQGCNSESSNRLRNAKSLTVADMLPELTFKILVGGILVTVQVDDGVQGSDFLVTLPNGECTRVTDNPETQEKFVKTMTHIANFLLHLR